MTDFRPIIADLDAKGYGVNKIAIRLGMDFTQIKRIKKHGKAEHSVGERLRELHREVCQPDKVSMEYQQ